MMELCSDLRNDFRGDGAFEEVLSLQGKIYRNHKNRRTIRIVRNGKGYFVKIHRRIGWGEILKNMFSLKWPVLSARNEYRAIKKLETLGIKTMTISGFGERGVPPVWLESFLITEELENTISLEEFCRDWKMNAPDFLLKTALVHKVADIARTLHQNGMNHRDFYICHFLLDLRAEDEKNRYEGMRLYLIDLHRVQIRKHTPERWIIKDIAGLFFSSMDTDLTRRDLFRFIKAYSGKPLRDALRDDQQFWNRVSHRATTLYKRHFHRSPALL
jgi:heptose I phosphotransferase